MQYICDFHIHSKYSRATSKSISVESLDKSAEIKGIQVLGTGDFTHPLWLKELKEKLESAEPGLFKLKKSNSDVRFILTVEISNIYSKNNRTRKIHNIIFAPDFKTVEKINTHLGWVGNLKSDGRPILKLDAKELVKIVLDISSDCLIVPAHIWTPWFGLFGSKSGFDSIEECFEEYSKYIYAIETGLSSDPPMNWRWSALDNITLISNSDAHSTGKIGREANVLSLNELNYKNIIKAIKDPFSKDCKLLYTIEFFPEEGKYHWDGHRNCDISLSPEESKEYNNICPRCGKPLTIGVMNRVMQLADRPAGGKPTKTIPYKSLIPLKEIIADVLNVGVDTKQVDGYYKNLIEKIGPEFKILIEANKKNIAKNSLLEIAKGIIRVREGKIKIKPGYDGEFGKITIFGKEEKIKNISRQKVLFP